MAHRKPAPRFLNLLLIRLPPGGIASIAHRVSGVLMFLSLPVLAYLLGLSVQGEEDYARAQQLLLSTPAALASLVLVWSFSHHLLAGIRHLLLDIEIGIERRAARASAWVVNLGALLITAAWLVVLL